MRPNPQPPSHLTPNPLPYWEGGLSSAQNTNSLDYVLQAFYHLSVSEPHDADLVLAEHFIPSQIIVHLILVNLSIDFNGQPCTMAIEVDDEPLDDLLPPEMKAIDLILTPCLPLSALGWSHALAEFLCQADLDRVNPLPIATLPFLMRSSIADACRYNATKLTQAVPENREIEERGQAEAPFPIGKGVGG